MSDEADSLEDLPPDPSPNEWAQLLGRRKSPCPGGCGEMVEDGLTHRPWACALARMKRDNHVPLPVEGIKWCAAHHGVADDLDQHIGSCDMVDDNGDGESTCDLRELFYLGERP